VTAAFRALAFTGTSCLRRPDLAAIAVDTTPAKVIAITTMRAVLPGPNISTAKQASRTSSRLDAQPG
jgi:hypothetical protein